MNWKSVDNLSVMKILHVNQRKNNKMKNTEQMFCELRDWQGAVGSQD